MVPIEVFFLTNQDVHRKSSSLFTGWRFDGIGKAYGYRRLSESEARSRLAMGDDEGAKHKGVAKNPVISREVSG